MLGFSNLKRRKDDHRNTPRPEENLTKGEALIELVFDADETFADLSIPEPDAEAEKPAEPPQATQPPKPINTSTIIALCGVTGGVGTTSLAVDLAYEMALRANAEHKGSVLARQPRDPRVCLVDLDFEGGACADHLDLLPSLSLADIAGPADRIDSALTSALVSTHASGLSLLAAPVTPGGNTKANPATIMALLDMASQIYDVVILDLPRHELPWTLPALAGADAALMICELTVPSLHRTRRMMARLDENLGETGHIRPLVNKLERRSFRSSLRLSDAETALGRDVFGAICFDPDSTREAMNCGQPVSEMRGDGRYAKDVRILIEKLDALQVELAANSQNLMANAS